MSQEPEPKDVTTPGFYTPVGTRRTFFQWITRMSAAIIGLGLGIPLIGYVISPALKRREQQWVEVGYADDLVISQPKQLNYVTTIRDGWMESKTQKAVWAVRKPDGAVVVYSPICTHLGCGYAWVDLDQAFKCPRHGSAFDLAGTVKAGPAPRPLDVLPSKIENGRLYVIYKEFKSGLAKAVEL